MFPGLTLLKAYKNSHIRLHNIGIGILIDSLCALSQGYQGTGWVKYWLDVSLGVLGAFRFALSHRVIGHRQEEPLGTSSFHLQNLHPHKISRERGVNLVEKVHQIFPSWWETSSFDWQLIFKNGISGANVALHKRLEPIKWGIFHQSFYWKVWNKRYLYLGLHFSEERLTFKITHCFHSGLGEVKKNKRRWKTKTGIFFSRGF